MSEGFKVPPGKVWLNACYPDDEYKLFSVSEIPPKKPGEVRLWVDGCFDMMHFGHANAMRQASKLGTTVFVGCHTDAEVMRFKGPPIMHEDERYEALRACKWVQYVVENVPYCTRLKDIDLFDIDYVVHGDDVSVGLDGRNSYQEIIDAGRMKIVKRTEGISTTDLVGRMLLCTKTHHLGQNLDEATSTVQAGSPESIKGHYITTSRKIVQFSNNSLPKTGDRIVYVVGGFDLFHVGHINVLKKARELGDYVIVGLYEDSAVNALKGKNYPIMNLNERVLSVLSCRYVDEVVMGVPIEVTKDIIDSLHVSIVVGGMVEDSTLNPTVDTYTVPKSMGIFYQVESGSRLTTDAVIERVIENRAAFLKRQAEKSVKDKSNEERKPDEYRNVQEIN